MLGSALGFREKRLQIPKPESYGKENSYDVNPDAKPG